MPGRTRRTIRANPEASEDGNACAGEQEDLGSPLDPGAGGQPNRRHARKNRSGNGAEGPRNRGHGVRFTAEQNSPKKNGEKCDNQQDFHESPPDPKMLRAMRKSALGGPKEITSIAWT
jgi:hypothetical protein